MSGYEADDLRSAANFSKTYEFTWVFWNNICIIILVVHIIINDNITINTFLILPFFCFLVKNNNPIIKNSEIIIAISSTKLYTPSVCSSRTPLPTHSHSSDYLSGREAAAEKVPVP